MFLLSEALGAEVGPQTRSLNGGWGVDPWELLEWPRGSQGSGSWLQPQVLLGASLGWNMCIYTAAEDQVGEGPG